MVCWVTIITPLSFKQFNMKDNNWKDIKIELPAMGEKVLCYWKEHGGKDEYVVCKLIKKNNKIIFEGWDLWVSHEEVTHWKYLDKP